MRDTQPVGRSARLAVLPDVASLVVLGAGIGGPPAISEILKPLRGPLPPIVVVQQMDPEYQRGFVAWLDSSTALAVSLARAGDRLERGHVYVAPCHGHLLVTRSLEVAVEHFGPSEDGRIRIDRTFESAAEAVGSRALGILLTGVGNDGAAGLLALLARGATTIAQDRETSVVYGMPRAAVESGAARVSASPLEIGAHLAALEYAPPSTRASSHVRPAIRLS